MVSELAGPIAHCFDQFATVAFALATRTHAEGIHGDLKNGEIQIASRRRISLPLADPADREVLELGGILEIHFLFNSCSIGVHSRDSELKRFGYLARPKAASDQLQHFQFTVSQTIDRSGNTLDPAGGEAF